MESIILGPIFTYIWSMSWIEEPVRFYLLVFVKLPICVRTRFVCELIFLLLRVVGDFGFYVRNV